MSKNQDIKILSDRDHCILRPGMYIGSTKVEKQDFWVPTKDGKVEKKEISYIPGAFKIFCEILDNALDEHIRGFCSKINILVDRDKGFYAIEDNGRGIPLEMHKEAKIPIPQVVFTQLKSGSNFDDTDRTTIGLNGVGASLATIFSEKLIIQVKRDKKIYQQSFLNNMEKIGEPVILKNKKANETGTIVKFKPDPKIFSINIPELLIHKRCLELSYMYPDLSINLKITSENDNDCFGCNDVTKYSSKKFEDFLKMFDTEYSFFEDKKCGMKIGILHNKFTDQFEHFSNVNGADTFRGGTHVDSLKEIVAEDMKGRLKKEYKIEATNVDVHKRLLLVVFQNWNAPEFEGQTKEKFVNDKAIVKKFFDDNISSRRLTGLLDSMKELKQAIYDDVTYKLEKKDLKDLKDKQKSIDKKKIPKLIDASGKDRTKCSLYITEGDSAISNLATVRDSKTMAGLPLRGKVMNVMELSAKDVLENKEIQYIMSSVGLKIGESPISIRLGKVDRNNLNYGKIIIATDQDMDGYCIRCLLLNFIFKFWPELIEHGFVYVLETPLYEVINKKTDEINYFYNKEDYEKFITDKTISKYEISYFKGLGSCGKDAWDYMINKNPNLIKVGCGDVKESKQKLLMAFGNDAELRKEWLLN